MREKGKNMPEEGESKMALLGGKKNERKSVERRSLEKLEFTETH